MYPPDLPCGSYGADPRLETKERRAISVNVPPLHPQLQNEEVRLTDVIDNRPLGRFHYLILFLSGAVMFLDGFDTQSISFAAPVIAKEWGLPVAALGPILSAAIVGLMIGYLVLSPLANRVGNRRVVIVCTAMFGSLTLASALAMEPNHLIALRFLTGAGLGAVIPSVVSLTSEFAPKRRRSSFVMFIYCWLALGFVAAGISSGFIIPLLGWRMMFVIGGLVPLVLLGFLIRYLPESPRFLLREVDGQARVRAILQRLQADLPAAANVVNDGENHASKGAKTQVAELFRRKWLISTILLWLAFVANLAAFYSIQSWLPTIVGSLGRAPEIVIAATVLTTIGGIVAAAAIGPAMDRISPFGTLGTVYLLGAVFVVALGAVLGAGTEMLLVTAFFTGACVTGGQMSVIALATVLYPPHMRSAGVGWALGMGRLGGIAGPLLVGVALGGGIAPQQVFLVMAGALVIAGVSVLILGRMHR
ncbi:MFS transporter [uncultured Arthrobacter sp.]|uniref:MFS transporter n=1 Tax=uncultured Arthrobacter sp. TaxID=114050 RepID=UPI0028D87026|nr:MFS transporter [uncultured Arthrobacter sp.]